MTVRTRLRTWNLFVSTIISTLLGVGQVLYANPPQPKPALKNSFLEVSKELDMGGSHFKYQSYENVKGVLDRLEAILPKELDKKIPEGQLDVEHIKNALKSFRKTSGLGEISGRGSSSFALGPNLYRNREFTHHYPESNQGILWKLFGTKPHEQEILEFLPDDTAAVFHTDLDVVEVMDWMKGFLNEHFSDQAQSFNENMMTGLMGPILQSYGGELGVALILDSEENINLPDPNNLGPRRDIPAPGLLLSVKTKNNLIYSLVKATLQGMEIAEIKQIHGKEVVEIMLPPDTTEPLREMKLNIQPVLFEVNGYLMLSSTGKIAQQVLAVQAGDQAGLLANKEFKGFSKNLNLEGNQITYVSERASRLPDELLKTIGRGVAKASMIGAVGFTLIELIVVMALAPAVLGFTEMGKTGLSILRVQTNGIAREGCHTSGYNNSMYSFSLAAVIGGTAVTMILQKEE